MGHREGAAKPKINHLHCASIRKPLRGDRKKTTLWKFGKRLRDATRHIPITKNQGILGMITCLFETIKLPMVANPTFFKTIQIEVEEFTSDTSVLSSEEKEYLLENITYLKILETDIKIDFTLVEESAVFGRMLMINWMMTVQLCHCFDIETLHLSVSILDRYFSRRKYMRYEDHFLIVTSALLIGWNYQNRKHPELQKFLENAGICYSHGEIFRMEREMLTTLNFGLGQPLPLDFLKIYNTIGGLHSEHQSLSEFILEVAILDFRLSHEKPSLQAAAVYCVTSALARRSLDVSSMWTFQLVTTTNICFADFSHVAFRIMDLAPLSLFPYLTAMRLKYSEFFELANGL
ncbi:G2/mitotic-specific cyclin-B-like [Leptinotarsa decemlineata]|uniref:G2/mitotic-specific cyclin-B-like n=1 Tax=Leptinotarsa decemlineata TaxID=7539 RepID=UPI003D30B46A